MEVVLSENAKFTLQTIFDLIEEKWSEKVADEFLDKVEKVLLLVSKSPEMFKYSVVLNARKGVISKQTSFTYEINKTSITILYFWDNRQEPIE